MADKLIKVTAKIDAGYHQKYGLITKGMTYLYDPADPFPDQIFDLPATGVTDTQDQPAQAEKKGR